MLQLMYHYCLMIDKIQEMQREQAKSARYMASTNQDLNPEPTDPKSHTALQILSVSPISVVSAT